MQNIYCWWCSRPLQKIITGKNKGQISFRVITTAGGNEVYVHVVCMKDAEQSQKMITAQPKDDEGK